MKKILSLLLISMSIISVSGFIVKQSASSETRVYKSGDVLQINGETIAVVANGTSLELITVNADNKLKKISEAIPRGDGIEPQSVVVKSEGGRAVAYVASGAAIQKYDLRDPYWPSLLLSVDSPIGYARDIDARETGNLFLIAGDKGVYEFEGTNFNKIRELWKSTAYGVKINEQGDVAVNGSEEALVIAHDGSAQFVTPVSHNDPKTAHPHITSSGTGFIGDDGGVRKLGSSAIFKNNSGFGYSLDAEGDTIYFANGWGVYALNGALEELNFQTINTIGGWARGVKSFSANGKRLILVFASDRIYLLDDGLAVLDVYQYQPMKNVKTLALDSDPTGSEAARKSPPRQPLSARVSKAPVAPGEIIRVYATGYYPGEPLILEAGSVINSPDQLGNIVVNNKNFVERTVADGSGNQVFEHVVIQEQASYPMMINIRVAGENSKLHYSVALQVQSPTPPAPVPPSITTLAVHTEIVKEIETTREVTEEQKDGKTIIHEIIRSIERLVESAIADLEIKNNAISIVRAGIPKNTYIRWKNLDTVTHTVSSIETPDKTIAFASPALKQNETYQFKFTLTGTYKYTIDGDKNKVYEIVVQ